MTHQEALAVVSRGVPGISQPESLAVRCVAWHESNYGAGWKPPGQDSKNWGAITKAMPCDNGFMYGDSKPDGNGGVTAYTTCFRSYPTHEAAAADVAKYVLKANVRSALANGEGLRGVAEGMYRNGYYTGVKRTAEENINAYTSALERAQSTIVAATGERPIAASHRFPWGILLLAGMAIAARKYR